ncbi:MAG: hypothetical protein ABJI92_18550 [Kangiellaceae bacterium]
MKDFQSFSDQVEVIILPRNTKWITNTQEGKVRSTDMIMQTEQPAGITIRDHQDLDIINPTMFSNTPHLARYRGDVPYTNCLVEQYANDL